MSRLLQQRRQKHTSARILLHFIQILTKVCFITANLYYIPVCFQELYLPTALLLRPNLLSHKADIGTGKSYQHQGNQPGQVGPYKKQALSQA